MIIKLKIKSSKLKIIVKKLKVFYLLLKKEAFIFDYE